MKEMLDFLITFLGAQRYAAQSMCLNSDYVLVNMFGILNFIMGACLSIVASILYKCYNHHTNNIRLAVVVLKDPSMVKLISLLLLSIGLEFIVSAIIVSYPIYYLDAMVMSIGAGIAVIATLKFSMIALSYKNPENVFAQLMGSDDVPDYNYAPIDGKTTILPLPVTHLSNKTIPPEKSKCISEE